MYSPRFDGMSISRSTEPLFSFLANNGIHELSKEVLEAIWLDVFKDPANIRQQLLKRQ